MVDSRPDIVSNMDSRPADTLAERLHIAFTDSGVQVAEVAEACQVSVQAVYKWLNGQTAELDGRNLAKVCELTGHAPMWIEFGTGPKIHVYATSSRAANVLKAMEAMSEAQRAALEQMALTLAAKDSPNGEKAA